MQFFQCITEIRIFRPVCRIKSAIYHRIYFFISRKWLFTRTILIGNGITHHGVTHIFNAGGNIAYHAGTQFLTRNKLSCPEISNFHDLLHGFRCHHADLHTRPYRSVFDTAEDDDTLIGIIQAVKNQCLQRSIGIPCRSRYLMHDCLQHIFHILSGLCRNTRGILCFYADHIFYLLNYSVRICTRQVDFINNRYHIQIMIQCQIHIRQCLCFYTLCCIHDEDCTVTGCQAS